MLFFNEKITSSEKYSLSSKEVDRCTSLRDKARTVLRGQCQSVKHYELIRIPTVHMRPKSFFIDGYEMMIENK